MHICTVVSQKRKEIIIVFIKYKNIPHNNSLLFAYGEQISSCTCE